MKINRVQIPTSDEGHLISVYQSHDCAVVYFRYWSTVHCYWLGDIRCHPQPITYWNSLKNSMIYCNSSLSKWREVLQDANGHFVKYSLIFRRGFVINDSRNNNFKKSGCLSTEFADGRKSADKVVIITRPAYLWGLYLNAWWYWNSY